MKSAHHRTSKSIGLSLQKCHSIMSLFIFYLASTYLIQYATLLFHWTKNKNSKQTAREERRSLNVPCASSLVQYCRSLRVKLYGPQLLYSFLSAFRVYVGVPIGIYFTLNLTSNSEMQQTNEATIHFHVQASEKKSSGKQKGVENWRFPMDPTNVPVK
jgi:hypothetical protein